MSELFAEADRGIYARQVDEWLATYKANNAMVAAVERDESDGTRWYVRMLGEEKEFTTVWLSLGQRTLQYETYFMPAPEENAEQLYEQLLRRNDRIIGAHFSVGGEDAVFLRGELPLHALTEPELDRILGTLYATVERHFPVLIRLGFASRFAEENS
jgi:hypothetical protein